MHLAQMIFSKVLALRWRKYIS